MPVAFSWSAASKLRHVRCYDDDDPHYKRGGTSDRRAALRPRSKPIDLGRAEVSVQPTAGSRRPAACLDRDSKTRVRNVADTGAVQQERSYRVNASAEYKKPTDLARGRDPALEKPDVNFAGRG